MRSKPRMTSRSRSAKKQLHKDIDGKTIIRKYKTFVRKLGKGQSDSDDDQDNRWRGATDFTRLSGFEDTRDDRYALKEEKRRRKSRSHRKKSNAEKREMARSISQENMPPRSYLLSR